MKSKNYHVVPGDDDWRVLREGASRASSVHETQRDAIAEGARLAEAARSELRIHGRDGRIRDSDSYGNDPFPPKDAQH